MSVSKILCFLAFLLVLSFGAMKSIMAEENAEIFLSVEQEWEYQHLARQIRCLTCEGQSVFESDVPMAKAVKNYLRVSLSNGDEEKKIIAYLTQRYGDAVFFEPKNKSINFLIWFIPLLLFLSGTYSLSLYYIKSDYYG